MLTYPTGIYVRSDDKKQLSKFIILKFRMKQSSFFLKKERFFVAQTIRAHTHPKFESHRSGFFTNRQNWRGGPKKVYTQKHTRQIRVFHVRIEAYFKP